TNQLTKKGAPKEAPFREARQAPSRHLRAARRTWHLPRVGAPRADLHLRDLAVHERAHDLQVRLPRASRAVVRVRDVVAEGDALVAVEAAIALNGHGLSPDRTRCAPSPLRHPDGGRS